MLDRQQWISRGLAQGEARIPGLAWPTCSLLPLYLLAPVGLVLGVGWGLPPSRPGSARAAAELEGRTAGTSWTWQPRSAAKWVTSGWLTPENPGSHVGREGAHAAPRPGVGNGPALADNES